MFTSTFSIQVGTVEVIEGFEKWIQLVTLLYDQQVNNFNDFTNNIGTKNEGNQMPTNNCCRYHENKVKMDPLFKYKPCYGQNGLCAEPCFNLFRVKISLILFCIHLIYNVYNNPLFKRYNALIQMKTTIFYLQK